MDPKDPNEGYSTGQNATMSVFFNEQGTAMLAAVSHFPVCFQRLTAPPGSGPMRRRQRTSPLAKSQEIEFQ